jgi:hypothetical protein
MRDPVPSTDWWLIQWGAGAAAFTAILLAVRVAWMAGSNGLRWLWRLLRRLEEMSDDWLGDKEKGIPPMRERVAALEADRHRHPDSNAANGRPTRGRA